MESFSVGNLITIVSTIVGFIIVAVITFFKLKNWVEVNYQKLKNEIDLLKQGKLDKEEAHKANKEFWDKTQEAMLGFTEAYGETDKDVALLDMRTKSLERLQGIKE